MEINSVSLLKKRKELGITQKELADFIGVSYQTIQNWESGKPIPKSKNQILGKFLEITENNYKNLISELKENYNIDKKTIQLQSNGIPYFDIDFSGGN